MGLVLILYCAAGGYDKGLWNLLCTEIARYQVQFSIVANDVMVLKIKRDRSRGINYSTFIVVISRP